MIPDEIKDLPIANPPGRYNHLAQACNEVSLAGDWAEFGVYKGKTARVLLKNMPEESKLYLFDSFKGLPEDWHEWSKDVNKGRFYLTKDRWPVFDDKRVHLMVGMFKDTVRDYAEETLDYEPFQLAMVHVDCDLYSSARCVLRGINGIIMTGTIIVFDEFFSFPGWRECEYKAFHGWKEEFGRETEYLFRDDKCRVTMRVTK